ncbi:ribosome maturation factor RimM [Thermodesulfobacteriota bacterium]
MTRTRLVVIGQVLKPFGVRGEVKIGLFTESAEPVERSSVLFLDETPFKVLRVRFHKGAALLSLEGIDAPEQVKQLAGSLVKTEVSNLPPKEEDEYYWFELIGLEVLTTDGKHLGKITNIIPTGANDVLQIEGDYGEVLLPMIDEVIIDIDVDEGKMLADPLEGLIPDG